MRPSSSDETSGVPRPWWAAPVFLACFGLTGRDGRQTKKIPWVNITTVVACALTIITVWPTHQSAIDGARSLSLAQWTAAKDFYEFCETVSDINHL